MAIDHANSFVCNFFEDDIFLKEVLNRRGFERYDEKNVDAENAKIVEIANEMGFHFDINEYAEANKNYMNELGGWEASKRVFHMIKVAANLARENSDE
ncbi:MAG: hypothetical protein J6M60_04195 [Clostridia bacterium]|nr:hypothetical protein [Clostridia bacterium]